MSRFRRYSITPYAIIINTSSTIIAINTFTSIVILLFNSFIRKNQNGMSAKTILPKRLSNSFRTEAFRLLHPKNAP